MQKWRINQHIILQGIYEFIILTNIVSNINSMFCNWINVLWIIVRICYCHVRYWNIFIFIMPINANYMVRMCLDNWILISIQFCIKTHLICLESLSNSRIFDNNTSIHKNNNAKLILNNKNDQVRFNSNNFCCCFGDPTRVWKE